ncbi:MAG: D-alanyl-D-alanine carboxypeptidase, partial [Betaproteobacteria bacterium]|nr:D-alanyl-D-alanine carboxypeptidase [Betaproteobacteria bacterium]
MGALVAWLCALSISVAAESVAVTPAPPSVAARAWMLVDANSGRTLAEQQADSSVEPASLTKLMTAYLTFAALRDQRLTLAQSVPVSEAAMKTSGARMFL